MFKAIFQGLFILTLVIVFSVIEAFLPLALPEAQAPDRFYHPDGLSGTLAGWQECRDAGLKQAKHRSERQIMGHCTNGYAVAQRTPLSISAPRVHDDFSACAFGADFDTPHRRFLSATIENKGTSVHVARIRVKVSNPINAGDVATNMVDIWLSPGNKAHRCLGVSFDFDTKAQALQFDQMAAKIRIEPLEVYGVSEKPQDREAPPDKLPFGDLPRGRNT